MIALLDHKFDVVQAVRCLNWVKKIGNTVGDGFLKYGLAWVVLKKGLEFFIYFELQTI